MSILWCGGEDIDFPNGSTVVVTTGAGNFRSAWARCALGTNGTQIWRSNTFPGGGVTSCWVTCQWRNGGLSLTNQKMFGLVKAGTTSGIWLGKGSTSTKLGLFKFDGTTLTSLASESGGSLVTTSILRFEMQIINFGVSSTINVYLNGAFLFSFSGDSSVTGVTTLDQVSIAMMNTENTNYSEVIVADTDTRSIQGLATLALTGAGTTNAWTNPTFSNINGVNFSDTNPTNSNTAAQENEYNVTDLPTGTFTVLAVKQSIRAAVSSTPTATQIKMGYDNAGTDGFGTGSTKTPSAAYTTIEQLDLTDPTTSNPFLQADMNGLQLNYTSA